MAEENIQLLNGMKFKRIVAQCPHCFNTLKNEYPQFGGDFEVLHFTQLLNELNVQLKGNGHKITYHDPCYLGRYNAEYQAPRQVLGSTTVEMTKNRRDSFCCGGGGGQMWLETDAETRLNKQRLQQALDSGADVVATACPYCLTMFEDAISVGGHAERIKAMDITELLLENAKPV
jgi:Fe-S oxidoreductase